jgi:aryl-alcohol dehydrogenase-like predicted oxidoreductase
MRYRALGKTGWNVSEIGYGAWGIGGGLWQGSDDQESMKALHAAVDRGVNFIDTALAYNEGHSERLVANLRKDREEVLSIATKIPPKNRKWPAAEGTPLSEAFPAEYIRECTEKSLRNLSTDSIDILQFHVWSDEWHDMDEWKKAVEELRMEGKVKKWGISINDHQPSNVLKTLETGLIDTVQVIYNIFDQSPEEQLFPYCRKNGIGVVVRVPLDEGGLTGSIHPETQFPDSDFRSNYFRGDRKKELQGRVEKLRALMEGEAQDVAELALRFILTEPAVSTLIPGMRRSEHVIRNTAVSDGRALSENLRTRLKDHRWHRNFYSA